MKVIEAFFCRLYKGHLQRLYNRGLRRKYSRLQPNHVFQVTIGDISFKLSFLDSALTGPMVERIEGRREPETVAIIQSLLRPGDRVLEIGACYGYFTMIMSHCVGPRGSVVSIESIPRHYQIVQHNLQMNAVSNVKLHNLFISSEFSRLPLPPHLGFSGLSQKGRVTEAAEGGELFVPAMRLSLFLREIGYVPEYIFMDIEGFEVGVFEDLSENYLNTHQPIIVFEVHRHEYKDGKDLDYLKGILRRHNYQYRHIADNLLCFPLKKGGSAHT